MDERQAVLDFTVQRDAALAALWRSALCRGLGPAEVDEIARRLRPRSFRGGENICRQGERAGQMWLVATGRVKRMLDPGGARYSLWEHLGPGDHFGHLAMLTDGQHAASAVAVSDTQLLALDRGAFDELLDSLPGFAANLSRDLGFHLREEVRGGRRRRGPKAVALVHSTPRTRGLVRPLAEALAARGRAVQVLTDRGELWPDYGNCLVDRLPDVDGGGWPTTLRGKLARATEHHDHVLLDISSQRPNAELLAILSQCDQTWWLIDVAAAQASCREMRAAVAADLLLTSRLHPVWVLHEERGRAPDILGGPRLAEPDFKVVLREPGCPPARNQWLGIERLVRHVLGTRIGLALGGGGARGLAHLGVLRGLEREGISFDLVAGTSSGALMGLAYAAGWSPDDALEEIHRVLSPGWLLRHLPGGRYAYLWRMFRSGGWNKQLRPYLGQATLEQLQIPLATVAVDLVTGHVVVRDRGDAIHAVLESINLPPIARPIVRDGMALVDGGTLNNLPADVVAQRGADLVVGVDVAVKLSGEFAGLPRSAPGGRPGLIETLLRVNDVQDHGLARSQYQDLDLLIAPDTSACSFADFSQGTRLAEAGEAAALAAAPQLKQLLADLERS